MRKNIAERVKNCKAQDDSAGKGIKVTARDPHTHGNVT